ncbi:MAG: hypothetical protein GC152_00205 [Alphaproteobacteria bacterium]|nr:hypothetical protein [Alphaproteobacteria bacterium]
MNKTVLFASIIGLALIANAALADDGMAGPRNGESRRPATVAMIVAPAAEQSAPTPAVALARQARIDRNVFRRLAGPSAGEGANEPLTSPSDV